MHRLTRIALLLAWPLACAPAEEGTEGQAGTTRSEIVGGAVAPGDPAVVALSVGTHNQYCTGTLIAPQTVLTAAHCVYSYGTSYPYYVLFGTYSSSPSKRVQVSAQHAHPSYNGNAHDIGILRLSQAVADVVPIEANPVALDTADVGKNIRHVGFGITDGSSGAGGGTKREVTYPIRRIGQLTIESGGNGQQTCGGDSGGPALLVTQGSNLERVAGIVSYGDQSCTHFGIDSRVDVDIQWVRDTMAAWEAPSCREDNRCVPNCTPIDVDCACASDGVCDARCTNLLKDPDCPRDCVKNGVCATAECPVPDEDCARIGGGCTSELTCASRLCLTDAQRASFYCSKSCAGAADCPSDMECRSGVCLYEQKPEVEINDRCAESVFCRGGVCSGPTLDSLRCAFTCSSGSDCPVGASCETGVDGQRYCRLPDSMLRDPPALRVELPRAPSEWPAAAGCASAGGGPLATLALALLAFARRRG